MMALPVLDNDAARRLFLDRHGLLAPPAGGRRAEVADTIAALGFVQVDSVNTVARAHDLILWSRRPSYRPPVLDALTRDRLVWEHWTHDAAIIPVAHFPHWRHRFARDAERLATRWRDWHGHDFAHRFDDVLDRIARDGGCTSGDFRDGESRGSTGWWDWHPSKTALEYLWRTGRIAVARRDGFRKVYDLTERVLPADVLAQAPDEGATRDWACNAALDRLGFATSGEIAAFWALVTPDAARDWCADAAKRGEIAEIAITCADGSLRRSYARPGTIAAARDLSEPGSRLRILSPFDPALRDRNRAERLWGFFFRIEIFVPEPKRVWGYYVFPVLEGDRIIGRIDTRARRDADILSVRAFWPEPGIRMTRARQGRLDAELARLARFAGVATVSFEDGWLRGG